jgi:hypothetical protein
MGHIISPAMILKPDKTYNPFLEYNFSVINETESTHHFEKNPTLKSKLLFMDYRFHKYSSSKLYCVNENKELFMGGETDKAIIKIGRDHILENDIRVPGANIISRRHAVIINYKDDTWIYDLGVTGTILNNERITIKAPLIGRNLLRIGKTEFEITNDQGKLF